MIRRVTGTGTAATMMLALLVLACVFVAVAGPRENLAAQTQALRRALAASSPQAASVVATANWNQFTSNLPVLYPVSPPNAFVTSTQISEVTSQVRGDLTSDGVPLAPAVTDLFGLTSVTQHVMSGAAEDRAHLGGLPANLEVAYRDPFTRYTALIAGRYPATGSGRTLQVTVTQQTAARLGLHVGSKLVIGGGAVAPITLDVTGIIRPRSSGSSFWASYPATAAPDLVYRNFEPVYWVVGVFVGTGEVGQLQQVLSRAGFTLEWHFPVALGGVSGDQAQRLQAELSRATAQTPPLSGDLAPTSGALSITTGLLTPLAAFIATQSAISGLTWLLFASLTVLAAVVLLLAAYMLAVRREAEFTMMRARGASVRQVAGLALRGCAIACLPAAAAGAVLAVALVPHSSPSAAWWLSGITALIAIVGPAVIAAWRHRFRRRPARPRRVPRRRLVTEATLCAAAVGGLIVLRSQQPTGGTDLYTSAVPVLVAIPAVVIIARLLPLVLSALLRTFGGRASATGFVGLARAARTSLTPVLPAFALVLALTLAAFAGMVTNAITRGEIAASWQAVGGDARIQTEGAAIVTPAARRAIGAVPGVRQTATAWLSTWTLPGGQPVDGIAVDPASYAALVATTQTWPQVPAAKLAFRAGQPVPVLASRSVAASLAGAATVTTQAGLPPLRVRVAGILSGTPAAPGDQAFFIAPITAIRGQTALPPNELLVTGSGISASALAATAQRVLPGSLATTRSAALDALSGAPLQHGIYLIFALAIAAAAGLGLVVMVLELALGTTDRELILARLATMGLPGRQRIWLSLLEIGPPLAAAAVAATGCALALPWLTGPALDLSVFTGSGVPVRMLPDFTSFVLPLAGLALLAVVALAIETRAQQRRGIAAQLRADG
jgi:putative ABC transport system permease protein